MRVHSGRALFMTVALAEGGAVAGAGLCWLGFAGWAFVAHGPAVLAPGSLLGIAVWALRLPLQTFAMTLAAGGMIVGSAAARLEWRQLARGVRHRLSARRRP